MQRQIQPFSKGGGGVVLVRKENDRGEGDGAKMAAARGMVRGEGP